MHGSEKNAQVGVERTRRKKNKPLDRLTRDCIAAEKAGMSYGQWKALHPHTPDEDEEEELEIDPDSVVVACEYCGGQFVKPKNNKVKRFCSAACQNGYNHQKRMKKRRQEAIGRPAVCPICGTDFLANYQHRIYCSSECYAESQRRKREELRAHGIEKRNTPKKLKKDLDTVVATCEHCGGQFVKSKNNMAKRFCSRTCQHRHTAKKGWHGRAKEKNKKEAANNGSV